MSASGPDDLGGVAVAALTAAVASQDVQPVYADQRALFGIARPGAWAGDVEGLLQQLPFTHRQGLRRAGRAIVASQEQDQRSSNRPSIPPPLPLLVEHGPTWFLLAGDSYVTCSQRIAVVELGRLTGQPTTVPTATGGQRWMTPVELYAHYGVRADQVIWHMGRQLPGWSTTGSDNVLTIPCCSFTDGVTEHSVRVDGWLAGFAGSRIEVLLDWIATFPHLGRPTGACYLQGPPDCGKGLLVQGLAALYGGERSSYDRAVLGDWTSGLRRSPLVHLDERASRDPQQRGSAAFRSLIGESSRELAEKYRSTTTIHGCPRLLITSNTADALRFSREDLDADDEQAIGQRIVHILVSPRAGEILRALGGRAETEGWCEADGELTAHLRWVIANRKVASLGRRLLVEGDSDAWLRGHSQREGLPNQILVAAAGAAAGADADMNPFPVVYTSDQAFVSAARLHQNWTTLAMEPSRPTLTLLGRGLRRLAKRVRRDEAWVYPLPVRQLLEVAEELGLDHERIAQRVRGLPAADGTAAVDW